jgi:DNA-binding NarL/FixJ family response regulator
MRILIGEDEILLQAGLLGVLGEAGIEVSGVVSDAEELVTQARENPPDLVLTDMRMPPDHTDDGLRAALLIRQERPGTPLVLLSQHVNRQYAELLLASGAGHVGYLLKQRVADVVRFVNDLHRIEQGATVLDPEVVTAMLTRALRQPGRLDALTRRQAEVLTLVAEGYSNAAIARTLIITEKSVVQHVSRIYDQLGLVLGENHHRRVLAALEFLAD